MLGVINLEARNPGGAKTWGHTAGVNTCTLLIQSEESNFSSLSQPSQGDFGKATSSVSGASTLKNLVTTNPPNNLERWTDRQTLLLAEIRSI